jgi:hypothetical protein
VDRSGSGHHGHGVAEDSIPAQYREKFEELLEEG